MTYTAVRNPDLSFRQVGEFLSEYLQAENKNPEGLGRLIETLA